MRKDPRPQTLLFGFDEVFGWHRKSGKSSKRWVSRQIQAAPNGKNYIKYKGILIYVVKSDDTLTELWEAEGCVPEKKVDGKWVPDWDATLVHEREVPEQDGIERRGKLVMALGARDGYAFQTPRGEITDGQKVQG